MHRFAIAVVAVQMSGVRMFDESSMDFDFDVK